MDRVVLKLFLAALLVCGNCVIHAQELRVAYSEVMTAPDDSTRFHTLWQLHSKALENGWMVSYKGVDTLRLDIPSDAQSIPLGSLNDFSGTVLVVRNNSHHLFLFSHEPANDMSPLNGPATTSGNRLLSAIDSGDYRCLPLLREGRWLVEVTDSTPWVSQREGRSYGHYRKELVYVENGLSADRPATPYSGSSSRASLRCRPLGDDTLFAFGNLTLLRDSNSTYRTCLLDLNEQVNAYLHHIVVVTPPSTLTEDRLLRIYNCYRVTLDQISILGTYSRSNHSGYGILMDNCRHTLVQHLYARSAWGIFGTNNMHSTVIEESDFNRFDIHCYGRDVTIRRCRQQDGYNQYSSVYGTILYSGCTFSNFTPILIEASYNAYPHFSFEMTNCNWHLTRQRHTLMMAGRLDNGNPARPELQEKCLPDIRLSGLSLTAERRVRILTLLHYNGTIVPKTIGGIRHISISDLSGNPLRLQLIDHPSSLALSNKVSLTLPSGSRQLHQFKKKSLSLINTH